MFVDYTAEPSFNSLPRLLPRCRHVHTVAFDQRRQQTIGVIMQLLQRAALWTDETF